MHSRWKLLAVSVAVLGLGTLIACTGSVSIGDGGLVAELTIAGKTFTITLGDGGIFDVRKGAAPIKKGVRVENLFEVDLLPKDRPSTAQVTMLPSNVTVSQLDLANKAHAPLQAITGSYDVVVYIGSASMSDPCDEGTRVGTFHITVSGGAVTLDRTALDLPQAALSEVLSSDFTLCFEVSGDADATIIISDLGFKFGADESAQTTAQFTFRNDDYENIHFLLPGQTFPENRVSPGQTATDSLANVQIGDSITVRCGRNGVVLDSTSCPTVTGTDYQATVVWDGSHVTCEAEQDDGGDGGIIQVPIDRNGDAVDSPATVNGVAYAEVGVIADNSPAAGPAAYPATVTVDLGELGLASVQTIYLATQSAHAWDIPNGVKVATFTCEYAEGGAPTTLDMVMGQTTAEWAFESPCQAEFMGGPVSHSQPPMVFNNPTSLECDREYVGHTFAASLRLDSTRTLQTLTLELEDAQQVAYTRTPPNASFLLLAQTHIAVTLEGPAGTPSGDGGDGTGGLTASDLAGCWRVTLNEEDDGEVTPMVLIYEIDSAGNLATLWVEGESEGSTNTVEVARFTTANAGFFGAMISNLQQEISVDASGTVDLSWSLDMQVEEDGETTSTALDIDDAVVSGDPPSSFVSDSVSGQSGDTTFLPPANGQKVDCPDVSDADVISQEEFELDFDLDVCGSGTAMMMPLMLLGLCWMKFRR